MSGGPGLQGGSEVSGGSGLQHERTALAWQRTGVSAAALAGTAVLSAAHLHPRWVLTLVAAVALLCAVAITVAVRPAGGRARSGGRVHAGSPWQRLLAAACLPVLLAVAGGVLALAR